MDNVLKKILIAYFAVFVCVFTAVVSSAADYDGPTVIIVGSEEEEKPEQGQGKEQMENEGERPLEEDVRDEGSSVTIIENAEEAEDRFSEEYKDGEAEPSDYDQKLNQEQFLEELENKGEPEGEPEEEDYEDDRDQENTEKE